MKLEKTEQMYTTTASRIMRMTHLSRYQLAKPHCKDKQVLDMGCGTGYGAYFLRNIANKIIAIDIDTNAIAFAMKNYKSNGKATNLQYKKFDVSSKKFPEFLSKNSLTPKSKFDVVISFEVIEHLDKQEQYLENVKSQLTSDGIFFCSTPQKGSVRHPHWHKKELAYNEFRKLLNQYFKNVIILAQKRKYVSRNKFINFIHEKIVTPNSYAFVDFSQYKECKYMVAICTDKDINLRKLI